MESLTSKKLERIRRALSESAPVVVAFSGGVDSTLVLKLALDELGSQRVLAAVGVSPSLPSGELEAAESLAKNLGAPFVKIPTHEMENENYRSNPRNRCYFCKEELFSKLRRLAEQKRFKTVVDGTNAEDAQGWRPGMRAARGQNVRSPLLEAGFNKEEIRALARDFNLPNWNKPAMPCLASRIPYGKPVSEEKLSRIDRAEKAVRRHGFAVARVRDHYPVARIEVEIREFRRLLEEPVRAGIVNEVKAAGYRFVTFDLAGFKSGSFNG